MSEDVDRIRQADAAVLQHLSRERLAYPTVVGVEIGIGPEDAKQRCENLADSGFVDPVTPEIVYRITDRGEKCLEIYRKAKGHPDPVEDSRSIEDAAPVGETRSTGEAEQTGGSGGDADRDHVIVDSC